MKDYCFLLQQVYDKLLELTDGEEDEELCQYNEYLLAGLEDVMRFFDEFDGV